MAEGESRDAAQAGSGGGGGLFQGAAGEGGGRGGGPEQGRGGEAGGDGRGGHAAPGEQARQAVEGTGDAFPGGFLRGVFFKGDFAQAQALKIT